MKFGLCHISFMTCVDIFSIQSTSAKSFHVCFCWGSFFPKHTRPRCNSLGKIIWFKDSYLMVCVFSKPSLCFTRSHSYILMTNLSNPSVDPLSFEVFFVWRMAFELWPGFLGAFFKEVYNWQQVSCWNHGGNESFLPSFWGESFALPAYFQGQSFCQVF